MASLGPHRTCDTYQTTEWLQLVRYQSLSSSVSECTRSDPEFMCVRVQHVVDSSTALWAPLAVLDSL